jgi:hypothetical protein
MSESFANRAGAVDRTLRAWMTRVSPPRWRALIALMTLAIAIASIGSITGGTVVKDAAQELQSAINLAHYGVLSEEENPPLDPSMYREPLPSLVECAAIGVSDLLLGRAAPAQYFSGERVKIVKYQNVLCLLLLWSTVIFAARWFTSSYLLAILAGLLAVRPFLSSAAGGIGINTLNTELLATLLLLLSSFWLALALAKPKIWRFAISGVFFGLLALTKASALYAFAGVVLMLLAARALRVSELQARIVPLLVLAASFAVVVLPWIGRNMYQFGAAEISLRGGLAIYTRALMDEVSREEYWGSYYVWAGPRLQPYVGKLMGFEPADLNLGGKLQRLNFDLNTDLYDRDLAAERAGKPDEAITLYRRARAERIRMQRQFTRAGAAFPDLMADNVMKRDALQIIKHNIAGDLEMTMPLIWRSGHWFIVALLGVLGYGLWARRGRLIAFVLPGSVLLIFYALITPYEPRWSAVVDAVAVIAVLAVLQTLFARRFNT